MLTDSQRPWGTKEEILLLRAVLEERMVNSGQAETWLSLYENFVKPLERSDAPQEHKRPQLNLAKSTVKERVLNPKQHIDWTYIERKLKTLKKDRYYKRHAYECRQQFVA